MEFTVSVFLGAFVALFFVGVVVAMLKTKADKENQNFEQLDLRVKSIEQYVAKKKKRHRRPSTKDNKPVRRVDNM
jgi:mannitol-specific phosphotransferase system IIBC component